MLLPDKNKLSTLLHNAPCSAEVLDFYKRNSRWFNERRLRRLIFHTSAENDHLVLPADEVRLYAARLLSMEEAFLAWFDALPGSHRKLVLLLVENPVLSADYAYKASGVLDGKLGDSGYKSASKTEILCDIARKQKYILENITIHKNGFVYCPALFRRYIASHLSARAEYRNLISARNCIEEKDFSPVPAGKVLVSSELDNIIEEKFSSVRSLAEAVEIIASSQCSFDALFLVPHLHLNARFWNSPETTRQKIIQAESVVKFLESPFFSRPADFCEIENSFQENVLASVPQYYLPAGGNGYFVSLKTEKSAGLRLNSSCFGKRLELTGGDFLHSFVSVPAFNNLLLLLCRLGFFECALNENPGSSVHNALLYPLGKIAAVRRAQEHFKQPD